MTERVTNIFSAAIASAAQAANPNADAEHLEMVRRAARDMRFGHLRKAEPPITDDDLRRLGLDDLDTTPHLAAVQRWWQGDKAVLVLMGTVGMGKTVAACWALGRLGGVFLRATDMWRPFQAFDPREQQRVLSCRVLVLDDLGREKDPAKSVEWLESIVDGRRSNGRRTIITTNLDPKGLRARYPDERLWSRLGQCFEWAAETGPDLRKGKA